MIDDRSIEQAFRKDRDGLPKQPTRLPASLENMLAARTESPVESVPERTLSRFFGKGLALTGLGAGALIVGALYLTNNQSPGSQSPGSQPPISQSPVTRDVRPDSSVTRKATDAHAEGPIVSVPLQSPRMNTPTRSPLDSKEHELNPSSSLRQDTIQHSVEQKNRAPKVYDKDGIRVPVSQHDSTMKQ